MNSLKVGYVIFLTGVTIALYLLVRRLAHCRQQCPGQESPRQPPQQTQGVSLRQVYPSPEKEITTDIDIIAIHGLDTKSPDTWRWKLKGADISKKAYVNWLEDQHMLPERAERCRIFMCDWPGTLLEEPDLVQKSIEEFARLLLNGIASRPSATNERPIVFIASCLGGVILMQALVMASDEYLKVRRATRGIVFLATPFQGTSFQDVANWAEPGLRTWAFIRRKKVTRLLDRVKGSTLDLTELVSCFTQLCKDKDHPYRVFTFYEMGYTDLYSKIFPWLPIPLQSKQVKSRKMGHSGTSPVTNPRQLVDKTSATLQIVPHPLPLDRPHVTTNKFFGPDDKEYISVAGKIEEILREIREGRPIDKADAWIREKHYTKDRLQIVRLSGDRLPMDQCYINLAIIEQRGEKNGPLEKRKAQLPSPFSLAARLKVATLDKDIQVELSTLFNPRKGLDDRIIVPRRILIRGRAGVGKTTLCKKIVYDFIYYGIWNNLFDRILWVPLRNLKREPKEGYTLEGLFLEEYFSQDPKGKDLAHDLWVALDAIKYGKTLFVLDGLDEVSEGLDDNSKMCKLLQHLLTLPTVIVTSRPHASLPYWLKGKFDLELETTGFHPDQVRTYVEKAFINPKTGELDLEKVGDIQSFLQYHQLVQDLVRIPIQLDALCFIWSDRGSGPHSEPELETMTAVYRAIECGLWKKDILKLEKEHEGKPVPQCYIEKAEMGEIENLVLDEIYLIEGLAFTGLHNDTIEFGRKHLNAISKQFRRPTSNILLDKTLPHLSFLRMSDFSSKPTERNYHFLHLTFQEYFAARYFVRCWVSDQQPCYLKLVSTRNYQACEPCRERKVNCDFGDVDNPSNGPCKKCARESKDCWFRETRRSMTEIPTEKFLQREKYNGRYDIFWRFVAGLLRDYGEEQLRKFLEQIEDEPRDLLGPAHQRLLMHCFNEVALQGSEFLLKDLREKMEHRCQQWSIYEYKHLREMHLCCESEFPDKVLTEMLAEGSDRERTAILLALRRRPQLSDNILEEIAALLKDDTESDVRCCAVRALRNRSPLPDNILQALVPRLEDTDKDVRCCAVEVLWNRSPLPDNILQALVSRLEDTDFHVSWSAVEALTNRSSLPDNILQALVSRLEDNEWEVRGSAVEVLGNQSPLPDNILQALVSRLEDTSWDVRRCAVEALGNRSSLPDNILQALVSRLEDTEWGVRRCAVWALGNRSSLPDNILQALVSRLEDAEWDVRRSAVGALGNRSSLPDNILQALVSRLEDTEWNVRRSAVGALGNQSPLPDNILQALVSRLEHTEPDVRCSAVEVLGNQSPLPDNILQALVSRLEDIDSYVRCSAVRALGNRSPLPDNILQALVSRLEDTEWGVRYFAVRALKNRSPLPDNILQALVSRLEDTKLEVRRCAVEALGNRSSLPDNILQALVSRLEDTSWEVRYSAVMALRNRSSLPDNILQALVSRLEHTDKDVRRSAVEVLGNQSSLPGNILQALVPRLEDTERDVRYSAVEALGNQSSLPDNILQALVPRLEDTEEGVRDSTVEALDIDYFYSILPSLNTHTLQMLYRKWVKRSVTEQISCFIQDGNLYIEMPNKRRKEISLLQRKDNLLNAFLTEASAIGMSEVVSALSVVSTTI